MRTETEKTGPQEEFLDTPAAAYIGPRVSPDGTQVAVRIGEGDGAIWIADPNRGTLSRVTAEGTAAWPVWTPDGQHVVFTSDRDGEVGLFRKSADGTGDVERLATVDGASSLVSGSWSPDGNLLTFDLVRTDDDRDTGVLSMDSDPSWEPLLTAAAVEFGSAISPDGRWVAYTSNDTGRLQVYAQRFPNLSERQRISTDRGSVPTWSPDGRELFYYHSEGMFAVTIASGSALSAGNPEVLFQGLYYNLGQGRNFDVAPDGERFLMIKETDRAGINVVLNWTQELLERVPVD